MVVVAVDALFGLNPDCSRTTQAQAILDALRPLLAAQIAAAVAEERERCVRIAVAYAPQHEAAISRAIRKPCPAPADVK